MHRSRAPLQQLHSGETLPERWDWPAEHQAHIFSLAEMSIAQIPQDHQNVKSEPTDATC